MKYPSLSTLAMTLIAVGLMAALYVTLVNRENFGEDTLADDTSVSQQMPEIPTMPATPAPAPTMLAKDLMARDPLDPKELLPVEQKDLDFAKANPTVEGILANKNFLTAGSVIGMLSEPHRNSNLSIRAEPVITKQVLSPWNNTTFSEQSAQGLGDVV